MKTRHFLFAIVIVVAATIAPLLNAQPRAANQPVRNPSVLTAAQALPLTCAEAWVVSDKDYARLRTLVVTLAKVSLVNRELTFPNRRDAGVDAGRGIAADCKADPNALLFAVVDKHVRRIAAPAP